jgi:uncharacterized membrane protein YpjA
MTKNVIIVALVLAILGAAIWYYMNQSNTPAAKTAAFVPTESPTGTDGTALA